MARFVKEITGPRTVQKDGRTLDITPALIGEWVKNFDRMTGEGRDIPLYLTHVEHPRNKVGKVSRLFTSDKGVFSAEVDVPLEEHARLIGPIWDKVSPKIEPFTNEKGERLASAVTHLAIDEHPVIPGQSNFEPVTMSLSFGDADEPVEDVVSRCLKDLNTLGIDLPAGTRAAQIPFALKTALETLAEEDDMGQDKLKELPQDMAGMGAMVMSLQQKLDAAEAARKVESDKSAAMELALKTERETAQREAKRKDFKGRIDAALNSGRMTPAIANKLKPLCDTFELALETAPGKSALETRIEVFEELAEKALWKPAAKEMEMSLAHGDKADDQKKAAEELVEAGKTRTAGTRVL